MTYIGHPSLLSLPVINREHAGVAARQIGVGQSVFIVSLTTVESWCIVLKHGPMFLRKWKDHDLQVPRKMFGCKKNVMKWGIEDIM
jgi:hypothetical protein